VGERYILGNRNYTWDRLFADLARLSGVESPPLKLPAPLALRLVELLERGPGRAPVSAVEVRSASQWWTYRNSKAKRELGWTTSPHEDTIEATVNWYVERDATACARRRSQPFSTSWPAVLSPRSRVPPAWSVGYGRVEEPGGSLRAV